MPAWWLLELITHTRTNPNQPKEGSPFPSIIILPPEPRAVAYAKQVTSSTYGEGGKVKFQGFIKQISNEVGLQLVCFHHHSACCQPASARRVRPSIGPVKALAHAVCRYDLEGSSHPHRPNRASRGSNPWGRTFGLPLDPRRTRGTPGQERSFQQQESNTPASPTVQCRCLDAWNTLILSSGQPHAAPLFTTACGTEGKAVRLPEEVQRWLLAQVCSIAQLHAHMAPSVDELVNYDGLAMG